MAYRNTYLSKRVATGYWWCQYQCLKSEGVTSQVNSLLTSGSQWSHMPAHCAESHVSPKWWAMRDRRHLKQYINQITTNTKNITADFNFLFWDHLQTQHHLSCGHVLSGTPALVSNVLHVQSMNGEIWMTKKSMHKLPNILDLSTATNSSIILALFVHWF